MFGPTLSCKLSRSLESLEFYLTNYNPDTRNIVSGYLPKSNKNVYVLGEELHRLVSQAYEKSLNSARCGSENTSEDYEQYQRLRERLITHVQRKKTHCESNQQNIAPNEAVTEELPRENDTLMKEYVSIVGQMEDFLWLVGVACEYELDDEIIGQDGAIQRLATKLFDDLGKTNLFPKCQIEKVKESLNKVRESYLHHEYSTTIETIANVKQQIGCA